MSGERLNGGTGMISMMRIIRACGLARRAWSRRLRVVRLRQQAGRGSWHRPAPPRPAASRISSSMSATACSSRPIPPSSRRSRARTLDKQAQWLQQYANYAFTVEGHADERGTREYNIALGARRAQTVRDYLDRARHPASACARSPTARSGRSRSATTSRAGRRTAAPSRCSA